MQYREGYLQELPLVYWSAEELMQVPLMKLLSGTEFLVFESLCLWNKPS